MRFAVLGDGAWGTAIALVLHQHPDHRVCLWSARPDNARLLRERRENVRLLPGIPIPDAIELTADIAQATAAADLCVEAIPTVHLRPTLRRIAAAIPTGCPFLSLTKGLEIDTFLRPSEVIVEVLGPRPVAVLSGPSHAEEVSRGLPATVVVASGDLALAQLVQRHLGTERLRIYTHTDVIGVELGGALKNIIGIAAGISDGLGLGDNAKAALMTRGIVEMARFGVALGAEGQTFYGLAGIGDLITTCISKHGRNRHVGEQLAQGKQLADILAGMKMVAEGVYTTRSVHHKASALGIDMPITAEIYRVLYEDKDPRAAVSDLMLREPKPEKLEL
ncbi:MAG: NAD(P)H-dependent glycerol-3-phosphate dehydrogenase [Gemmataceae bacterium]